MKHSLFYSSSDMISILQRNALIDVYFLKIQYLIWGKEVSLKYFLHTPVLHEEGREGQRHRVAMTHTFFGKSNFAPDGNLHM